jgi:hypothetical protein
MIKAARMRDRKLAYVESVGAFHQDYHANEVYNLIRDAFYLQDIVANQDSLDQ